MSNVITLTISDTQIRRDNQGRYCLNDLHKAAGNNSKHQPANFLRLDSTKELSEEINRSSDMMNAIEVKQGGKQQGTYVVKELVYAYAMWISPAFSLKVIRAYDALVNTTPTSLPPHDYTTLQTKYITLLEQENQRLKNPTQLSFGARRAWGAAEDQELLAMKAQGLGYTRIGYRMGRSGASIKHRYVRLMAQQGGTQ